MDELDRKLIAQVRCNARAGVATLAKVLKVSRGTITNRLARMEKEGVIAGYTVRLRPELALNEITAWTSVAVEGTETRKVIAQLLGEPAVTSLHDTNGRWDLLIEIRTADLTELAKVLERIRLIKGIQSSETNIHLQSYR